MESEDDLEEDTEDDLKDDPDVSTFFIPLAPPADLDSSP